MSLTNDRRIKIVKLCKEGLLFHILLTPFEHRFIIDLATRYSQFGIKMEVSADQWDVIDEIAEKLCL